MKKLKKVIKENKEIIDIICVLAKIIVPLFIK
jgi:hypothetical protein